LRLPSLCSFSPLLLLNNVFPLSSINGNGVSSCQKKNTPSITLSFLCFQFSGYFWLADVGPRRNNIGQCKYYHLKNLCITDFQGGRGQLEFILHVVENAPALEVVIVELSKTYFGDKEPPFEEAKRMATAVLTSTLPQNVNLTLFTRGERCCLSCEINFNNSEFCAIQFLCEGKLLQICCSAPASTFYNSHVVTSVELR
jgi:hypothetical protein